jgi:hypothetical protein
MADVLRGYSGDPKPPNPKNRHEYIGIDVALERATRKPLFFTFHIDPKSQQNQGILLVFTKNMDLDLDSASKLPISTCDAEYCDATIPNGIVEGNKNSQRLDLLESFLSSDGVIILYVKNGKQYRTMVLLSSFKKQYQTLLSTELAPN